MLIVLIYSCNLIIMYKKEANFIISIHFILLLSQSKNTPISGVENFLAVTSVYSHFLFPNYLYEVLDIIDYN